MEVVSEKVRLLEQYRELEYEKDTQFLTESRATLTLRLEAVEEEYKEKRLELAHTAAARAEAAAKKTAGADAALSRQKAIEAAMTEKFTDMEEKKQVLEKELKALTVVEKKIVSDYEDERKQRLDESSLRNVLEMDAKLGFSAIRDCLDNAAKVEGKVIKMLHQKANRDDAAAKVKGMRAADSAAKASAMERAKEKAKDTEKEMEEAERERLLQIKMLLQESETIVQEEAMEAKAEDGDYATIEAIAEEKKMEDGLLTNERMNEDEDDDDDADEGPGGEMPSSGSVGEGEMSEARRLHLIKQVMKEHVPKGNRKVLLRQGRGNGKEGEGKTAAAAEARVGNKKSILPPSTLKRPSKAKTGSGSR